MLTSAGMLPRLHDFMVVAFKIEQELDQTAELYNVSKYVDYATSLEHACTWTLEELIPLVMLPNNAAYNLEFARAKVFFCAHELRNATFNHSTYDPATSSVKFDVVAIRTGVAHVARELEAARAAVKVGIDTCTAILPPRS